MTTSGPFILMMRKMERAMDAVEEIIGSEEMKKEHPVRRPVHYAGYLPTSFFSHRWSA